MIDPVKTESSSRRRIRRAGIVLGPAVALAVYTLVPDATGPDPVLDVVLGQAGRATAGVAAWMAVWWMTEAIPVFATALIPIAVFPLFGATTVREAAAPYGHELIYLFLGGFILALAMERWHLHRRFAFNVLRVVGGRARRMVGAFMGITAFLSMWVSNTATTIMMLPIAMSVIDLAKNRRTADGPPPFRTVAESTPRDESDAPPAGESGDRRADNFATCMLLGLAYSASIGGIGTLIGTPPNLFLASFAENTLGVQISFVRWMAVALPLVVVTLPIVWLLLTRVLFPVGQFEIEGGGRLAAGALVDLGRMGRGEWSVLIVFAATAALWITRPVLARMAIAGTHPFAGLTDAGVAVAAALILFVIPVDAGRGRYVMDWESASRLPWGILILFGGGLSLASAIRANGVGAFIGHQVAAAEGMPPALVILVIVSTMVLLTELTSNTATTATLVPILAGAAVGMNLDPLVLVVPAAIAASCAFMLPVATPPNAIVFGAGRVTMGQMIRAGIWLNVLATLLVTLLAACGAGELLRG